VMPRYGEVMAAGEPYISLLIDTKDPIELGDFVSTFTSIANQYEKFVREQYPDASSEAAVYVSETATPLRSDRIGSRIPPFRRNP
jgi:hypothetical protein